MENIIYAQFRGDELLMINPTTLEVKNMYDSQYGKKLYGNLILSEDSGTLVDDKGSKHTVEVGDVIFVTYGNCFVIKNKELGSIIENELARRAEVEKKSCISEAKTL